MERAKWIPRLRIQTYKSNLHAMRSFYKYVYKEGYFTKLVNGSRPAMSNPYSTSSMFLSGYPRYDASKSYIRDRWERIGNQRLEDKRIAEMERHRTWWDNLFMEEKRRDTILFDLLEGTGVTAWDIVVELGSISLDSLEDRMTNRDLIEAQAFYLAIKSHIKQHKHEQHNRTPKRSLRTSPRPTEGRSNRKGCNRNDQCCREGASLRQVAA